MASSAVMRSKTGIAIRMRSVSVMRSSFRPGRCGTGGGRRRGRRRDGAGRRAGAFRRCPGRSAAATTSRVSPVVSSSRRAASTRVRSTKRLGLSPTSAVNTRVKWRTLIAAAAARAGRRWSPPGAASTRSCTARTVERSARGTHTGEANCVCPPGRCRNMTSQRAIGLRDVDAEVVLDHGQGEVDARGDARARPDLPVADVDGIGVDGEVRVRLAQLLRPGPVRRHPAPAEQSRRGAEERARAHRGDAPTARRGGADPGDERLVSRGGVGAAPAGQHERVDALVLAREQLGAETQPALGAHRATGTRGQGDPVPTGTAHRRGRPAGAGEDLVRADRIEGLDPVEGDDHDVALLHGHHSEGAGSWRQ